MKNRLYISFLLLTVWSFTSCKKDPTTTANVLVTEVGSDKPVVGAKVYLYGGYVGFLGGGGLVLLETYFTETNGMAWLEFNPEDFEEADFDYYAVRAAADQYYVDKSEYDLTEGEYNYIKMELTAEAYFKLFIKNVNKSYDYLYVDPYGSGVDVNVNGNIGGGYLKVIM